MEIAVIGAETAGLAVSVFLKKSGHEVTIFERFDSPRPVGVGLMLQPTGLAVLARLGLDKAAIEASSKIYGIQGKVVKTGRTIFDVAYSTLSPNLFGLGIHRGTLFSLLYREVLDRRIPIVTSMCVEDIVYDHDQKPSITDGTKSYGPFDLVINAQGAKAPLRSKFVEVRKNRPYPYAAVWGICKDYRGSFKNALFQRYLRARHMIGVMPMGKLNGDDCESVALFWSLRVSEYPAWRTEGFKAWQDYVISLWPEVEPLVQQFRTSDDLSFATYGDVSLKTCYAHRLLFIGDAAHATSPQLGQGANMALLDAYLIDECLRDAKDVNSALAAFSHKRKKHVRFYQTASHWLTPFFQSDSYVLPFVRDLLFGVMCRLPAIKTEMVRTLAGVKTGLLTSMNPGQISQDYDVRQH